MIAFVEDPDGYKIEFIEKQKVQKSAFRKIKECIVSDTPEIPYHHQLKNRFRGYFPVIIDVETAGFDAKKDALFRACRYYLKNG